MEFKMPMNLSSKPVSVLVVGDDARYLSVVAMLLEKCNYQVVTVKHPLDALSTLQINDHLFDLVVTDLHKPDMNGFQQVITQAFDLPVLSMSAEEMKLGKQGNDSSVNFAVPTKSKIIWTESLHNKFLEAIRDIGFDKAKPAKILEHMKVPGLTRENVSSHLQKYRNSLRRVTGAGSGIPAPDINLASRANQLTIASGTFGKYSQLHQENFGVQSSIPSSSIHTSTGYLTGNLQHLKNKGVNSTEESQGIGDFSTSFMNQGNVQPHQVNAAEESQGIGGLNTSFMNQRNVQPHQKYRNSLRQVTGASCRIQAPDINLASRANQSTNASGTFCKYSQFHQQNLGVQSSIPSSSIHTSTGYLTGNLQHYNGKEVDAVPGPVRNFSVFHNVKATEESQGIADFSTTFMNQGNVQPHQVNAMEESQGIADFSTSFMNQGNVQPHQVNAMEESQGIGDLSTSFMNQGNVQRHQQNNEDETSVSQLPWWL